MAQVKKTNNMPNVPTPNELSPETKASMKMRVIVGVIMAVVAVPCLFLGSWFYLALAFFCIGASTYEIAKLPSRKLSWGLWVIVFITMYSLVFWVVIKSNWVAIKENFIEWIKNFDLNTSFNQLWLSPVALATMIFVYFIFVVFKKEFTVKDACYLIAMTLLIALAFQAALYVRYIPFTLFGEVDGFNITVPFFRYFQSALLFIYLCVAVCFNDMGAYFVGVLFGKHKINPRISPKKTWEGFVGGVVISFILSFTMGMVCAALNTPILPFFTVDKFYWILLCSLLLPFFGNLGDFAFSAIKRAFNKKDFSRVLGPHGGILDRLDSILFGVLALAILVAFISNDWNFAR